MAVKVAINGLGRIGRCVARIIANRDDVELVATNASGEESMIQYNLRYDTVHGNRTDIDVKDDTPTFVMGVNEDTYTDQTIVSNASCTTNGLAPVAKVLDDSFGIEKGLMTTIHSYTGSQPILDAKHKKDPRKARAGATNLVPTTTGVAKAIGKVMPHLNGKLNGQAIRVPTPNVSMVDLTVTLNKDVTLREVQDAFSNASEGYLELI